MPTDEKSAAGTDPVDEGVTSKDAPALLGEKDLLRNYGLPQVESVELFTRGNYFVRDELFTGRIEQIHPRDYFRKAEAAQHLEACRNQIWELRLGLRQGQLVKLCEEAKAQGVSSKGWSINSIELAKKIFRQEGRIVSPYRTWLIAP